MHLALVSEFDPHSAQGWSGIAGSVATALRNTVERVSLVGPLPNPASPRQRVRQAAARLQGQRFLRTHTIESARTMGMAATESLRQLEPDAILVLGSTPVGFIDTPQPLAMWSDATFESNLYAYADYSGLATSNIDEGHAVELAAMRRADVAAYASEYARRSAVGYYDLPESKSLLAPFGANLSQAPTSEAVAASIDSRQLEHCQILFIGKEWVRKGGDVAARVVQSLRERGRSAELVVVGSDVPSHDVNPRVRALGFIDKGSAEGRAQFEHLLQTSHFFLMPSRAEAFGCVFCEASAYGIPSVAPAVGGIPSAVADGENGILLPPHPTPGEIAERMEALFSDPDAYRALCHSSRTRYERELNWDVSVRRVVDRLKQLL